MEKLQQKAKCQYMSKKNDIFIISRRITACPNDLSKTQSICPWTGYTAGSKQLIRSSDHRKGRLSKKIRQAVSALIYS
jgi:hypothetical protein